MLSAYRLLSELQKISEGRHTGELRSIPDAHERFRLGCGNNMWPANKKLPIENIDGAFINGIWPSGTLLVYMSDGESCVSESNVPFQKKVTRKSRPKNMVARKSQEHQ